MSQWSNEKAWEWYRSLPFLRGSNFIGSDCANRRDFWQSYRHEERLVTAERELALSEKTGFNTVRIIMDFDVYYQEPESYMKVLEDYISLCAKYHQYVMIVLTCEAQLPRGMDEPFVPKKLGEQEYALGYHQGRAPLSPEMTAKAPYHWLERGELVEPFMKMIGDTVEKYKDDPRVICWNVYNEPGITIARRSLPLLEKLFAFIRGIGPSQPLTADIWRGMKNGEPVTPEEKWSAENSDVISFHSYSPYPKFVLLCEDLKKYGRPLLCTEWLNRINHNDVKEIYPFFYYAGIASYCWGFVVGKTQTNEPWESLWNQYYDPTKNVDYDFTKWQHDLFRPSLKPYDPKEIELIEQFNKLADERYEASKRL